MNNNYYYFTFGSSGQIHEGGWVEIEAGTLGEAQKKFIEHYGEENAYVGNLLNYSFSYNEEEFVGSCMNERGNLGKFCHEVIK